MARPTRKRSRQHQPKPQPTVFARQLKAAMDERGWTANETARRVREALGEGAKFTPPISAITGKAARSRGPVIWMR